MIIALAGVTVIIALVIVFATGGGDDEPTENLGTIGSNGAALPAFDGQGASDPALGTKAPIVSATDLDGNPVVIDASGGPNDTAKVILFAAHWCPTCQAEIPEVAEYLELNELPEGVEFVTVSTFPNASRDNYPPDAWFASVDWPHPVVADTQSGEIADLFGMSSVPSWVVLDNTRTVIARTTGALGPAGVDQLVQLAAG